MVQTLNVLRKERLERLLDLAQAYRGWTRRELAQRIGRDPTKLAPDSGNPKFDVVLQLAEVLDWTLDEVAQWLWYGSDNKRVSSNTASFEQLDIKSLAAHRAGEYQLMIDHAQAGIQNATSAEERARGYNRVAGGWDGLGRFKRVLQAAQSGLREHPIPIDLRLLLQTTSANAHYTLWQLDEAQGMMQRVVEHYEKLPPTTERAKVAQAHAWYVLGHSLRRMLEIDPVRATQHAEASRRTLERAMVLYEDLAKQIHESFGGIANTCRGGLLETEVLLGRIDAREALARIVDIINVVVEPSSIEKGDWLESYGWWCIFGCNITLRHITLEKDLQRFMALFTNKADEIADRLDHWSMRERVFSMQFEGRQRLIGWTGQDIPIVIDNDDIRLITGTMGRFPQFRETGWSILNCGNIVQDT